MGMVMRLANGSCENILSVDDFEDIIDKYLGSEAANYFRSVRGTKAEVEELEQKNDLLCEEVSRLRAELDKTQADYENLEAMYEEVKHNE